MLFRYVTCDVFTDRPLAGNPLAVFPEASDIPEELLQALAREINLSETVFVYPPAGEGDARIRIFTPGIELPFAGHPVLGTAFVLAAAPRPLIVLETGAGPVPVRFEGDGSGIRFGRMTQPVPEIAPFPDGGALLSALGVDRSELPIDLYTNGPRHVSVKLPTERDLAQLAPDLAALARLPVTVTLCVAGSGRHWKARAFVPSAGIPEDPASGSAVGPLACHLARHGLIAFGEEIEVTQGVEIGRPSTLYARVDGSRDRIENVEVGGRAVIVGRGEFEIPVPSAR
jgi:trans-2,3-dihydro-3-hydroxyanthranilate isomerase